MRSNRARHFERRNATPNAGREAGLLLGGRRRGARLWPLRTVLRRVERLVEAEEALERESMYSNASGGDDPNA